MDISAASLAFVQGVASSSITEAARFVHLTGDQILTTDGLVTLAAPATNGFDAQPSRDVFFRILKTVKSGGIRLQKTDASLIMTSEVDAARHKLPYIDNADLVTPPTKATYRRFADAATFRRALVCLSPIMSDDPYRSWAQGIFFVKGTALATNNIVIAEHAAPLSDSQDSFLLPRQAVREILRITDLPVMYGIDESTLTLVWPGRRWMKCCLIDERWSPEAQAFLDGQRFDGCAPIAPEFREAVKILSRVVDDRRELRLEDGLLRTSAAEHGSEIDIQIPGRFACDSEFLSQIFSMADAVDFTAYPAPIPFVSSDGMMRGVFMGKTF